MDTEEFIRRAKEVHGDTYEYSKVSYTLSAHKVTIVCSVHGTFTQRAFQHLQGRGCRKCGWESAKAKKVSNYKEFIDKANKVHWSLYLYGNVTYVQSHSHVLITCKTHGDFSQTPSTHLVLTY